MMYPDPNAEPNSNFKKIPLNSKLWKDSSFDQIIMVIIYGISMMILKDHLNDIINIPFTNYTIISLLAGIFLIGIIKLSSIKNYSKTYSPEAFGLLWILITLSPTSSVVPLLDVAVEHRTYLPLVGFSIALASMLVRLDYFIQQQVANVSEGIFNRFVPKICRT